MSAVILVKVGGGDEEFVLLLSTDSASSIFHLDALSMVQTTKIRQKVKNKHFLKLTYYLGKQ